MFKKNTIGLVALAYLSTDVQAMKQKYRPTPNSAPWHKAVKRTSWDSPTWPVNYKVPDFGVDEDIANTSTNLAGSEKLLKTQLHADFKAAASIPRDYFVPDFGLDHDVMSTQSNLKSAESNLGTTLHADFGDNSGIPRNYFVPNFGIDEDMRNVAGSLKASEAITGMKLADDLGYTKDPPRNYFVPDFGVDSDIKDTQASIKQEENLIGPWNPTQDENGFWLAPSAPRTAAALQVESQINLDSDPICNSSGCTQYKHPE
jgi:hypothetical protein